MSNERKIEISDDDYEYISGLIDDLNDSVQRLLYKIDASMYNYDLMKSKMDNVKEKLKVMVVE